MDTTVSRRLMHDKFEELGSLLNDMFCEMDIFINLIGDSSMVYRGLLSESKRADILRVDSIDIRPYVSELHMSDWLHVRNCHDKSLYYRIQKYCTYVYGESYGHFLHVCPCSPVCWAAMKLRRAKTSKAGIQQICKIMKASNMSIHTLEDCYIDLYSGLPNTEAWFMLRKELSRLGTV